MTDDGRFFDLGGWGSAGQEVAGVGGLPRARAGRPEPEHEDFARALTAFVEDILDAYLPKSGTVTGMEGGAVRVQFADEPEPRDVGFPRSAGVTYQPGDKVMIQPTRSGEPVVHGPFRTATGQRGQAVHGADDVMDGTLPGGKIVPGSVTKDHLGSGSVGTPQIEEGAVTSKKIGRNAITGDELAQNAVGANNISNGAVGYDKLSGNVQNSLGKADTALQPNDVSSGPTKAEFNRLADEVAQLKKDVRSLENTVDNLKNRGGDEGGGSNP